MTSTGTDRPLGDKCPVCGDQACSLCSKQIQYWKDQLHRELADATLLVWKLQNGLSDGAATVAELAVLADQLNYRTLMIQSHCARWLLIKETATASHENP